MSLINILNPVVEEPTYKYGIATLCHKKRTPSKDLQWVPVNSKEFVRFTTTGKTLRLYFNHSSVLDINSIQVRLISYQFEYRSKNRRSSVKSPLTINTIVNIPNPDSPLFRYMIVLSAINIRHSMYRFAIVAQEHFHSDVMFCWHTIDFTTHNTGHINMFGKRSPKKSRKIQIKIHHRPRFILPDIDDLPPLDHISQILE